jgi:hypothetical protein
MTQDNRNFTANDLTLTAPATERIRRDPTRYLGARLPTPPFMASALVQDALICGCKDVRVQRYDNWTSVSAGEDWIIPNLKWERTPTYEEVFRAMIPFPQAGPNSFRSEVLVAAFSTELYVVRGESVTVCIGDAPPDNIMSRLSPMPFMVVFRLELGA